MESREVTKKKKICVVTTSRADYGRLKPVMGAVQNHPNFELQVIVGTPLFFDHLLWYLRHGEPVSFFRSLPWYIRARTSALLKPHHEIHQMEYLMRVLTADGFPISARLPLFLEGGNLTTMVKSAAFGLLGIPDIFESLRPDVLLLHGDRFEILPVAMAAAFLNIPIAHLEGGDVSGTIDNSVRHAITKLAHIHFPVTQKSKERILAMGEDPRSVHLAGSPIIDFLMGIDLSLNEPFRDMHGPGVWKADNLRGVDLRKPFIIVSQHPVTTEYRSSYENMESILKAVDVFDLPKIFIAPNIDGGQDGISSAIREYRERQHSAAKTTAVFFRGFSPKDFCRILKHAAVAVGNSSSFLREGGYFGTPVVLVGNRQDGRERGVNVIDAEAHADDIRSVIEWQLEYGPYPSTNLFGDGTAAKKIVDVLSRIDFPSFSVQKQFHASL
ncbi:MAG: UDP-N-acetylglucosamine 2-epimerase [Parcubacteria group bacterium GW2011_GWB1_50_9]|uniref:UDP-N-acetylglucosamine 2-epimerase n=2 Tax=Parcubacteria group TaxID=1794811 RepID=A0A0G1WLQ4_9BACT|nr:MAG: UDP-N-acetylglucosamine 2-epimerase [Parcubacteria group bacterium GW2011_GWB1_50_9]KKW19701.1 MAG: UDP-N-acetylglucosamine 2-epimerase [Candidatus Adlerbacteria bacterium GW2011_GWC1_50_9]